ncbi:MAG TPA: hypothetical protein VHU91_08495, partial [Mycobacteriales bacterium]|nr:hypothetical protein [Mycobacteriales bacterium]
MTVTAHRRKLTWSELRIVSPVGTTAAFVAELAVEAGRKPSRRARLTRALTRSEAGRGWRFPAVLLLLLGVLLSAYLLNVNDGSGSHVKQVGSQSTAAANCPLLPIPDSIPIPRLWPPGFTSYSLAEVKTGLNNFCDAVDQFANDLKNAILSPIKDGIWAAFNPNRLPCGRTALSPEDPGHGLDGLMQTGVSIFYGKDKGQNAAGTTWDQYGTAGASWDTYFLDCFDTRHLINFGANFIFDIAKVFAVVAILLFQQTFNSKIIDYFFLPQNGAQQSSIDHIMQELNAKVYVELFSLAVVIGAVVLLVRALMLSGGSGGLPDVLGKVGIMAAVVGFAAFFMAEGS